MRVRVFAGLIAAAVAAVCMATVAPAPQAGAATDAAATPSTVIKHVVVVMQSGHSFDNYFGTRAGVNNIPAGVCLPLTVGSTSCIKPYHLNPNQSRAGLSDTLRTTERAINGGKMDGFVLAQPNLAIGSTSVGNLRRQDLPYYWSLADRFTLYDNFFAASRAGSLPNRLAAVSGQDGGLTTNTPPVGGIVVPTVFDQLEQAHLGWKYYVQNYTGSVETQSAAQQARVPLLSMPAIAGNPDRAGRIVDTGQYYDDLINGQLPAVSYITGTVNSERSPLNPTLGEFFVKSLINALMQSPEWNSTVLLLAYDDAGGWYDHAAPPVMGGVAQGIRVPVMMVSPFSKSGGVDHGQMNTTSIPGLIDRVFGLPFLTPQVSAGGNLLSGVNLHQQTIAPLIAPLSKGALIAPRPDVLVIYVLYLMALLGAVLLFGFAFRRYRSAGLTVDDLEDDVFAPVAYLGNTVEPTGAGRPVRITAEPTPTKKAEPTPTKKAEPTPTKKAEPTPTLFALAHESNPYDVGTAEHDAWQDGHDRVPMSWVNGSSHDRAASECSRAANRLLDKSDPVAAAAQRGMAAAHSEASADLAEAKQFDGKTFIDDAEFSPRDLTGAPLAGSARLSYAQGYALGKNESDQADDPAAYMERARTTWKSAPKSEKSEFHLAKGRFEGAMQAVADAAPRKQ